MKRQKSITLSTENWEIIRRMANKADIGLSAMASKILSDAAEEHVKNNAEAPDKKGRYRDGW